MKKICIVLIMGMIFLTACSASPESGPAKINSADHEAAGISIPVPTAAQKLDEILAAAEEAIPIPVVITAQRIENMPAAEAAIPIPISIAQRLEDVLRPGASCNP